MTTRHAKQSIQLINRSTISDATKEKLVGLINDAVRISESFPDGNDNFSVRLANNAIIADALSHLLLEFYINDFPIDFEASISKVRKMQQDRWLDTTTIANMAPRDPYEKKNHLATLQLLGYPIAGLENEAIMDDIAMMMSDEG